MIFITHGFRVSVVSDVRKRVRDLGSPLRFILRRSSLVECVSVLHGTCLQCVKFFFIHQYVQPCLSKNPKYTFYTIKSSLMRAYYNCFLMWCHLDQTNLKFLVELKHHANHLSLLQILYLFFSYSIKLSRYIKKAVLYWLLHKKEGPSWSWSYGSWIYNYLCNQCLSSLMLWVQITIRGGVQQYVIKIVSDLQQVSGFLRVLQFPPTIKLTATI
jgi:hypothetical protein